MNGIAKVMLIKRGQKEICLNQNFIITKTTEV